MLPAQDGLAAKVQDLLHQVGRAAALLPDHFDPLVLFRPQGAGHQHQLRVQADGGQDIVKVAGHAGRQLPHRRQPLLPHQLLLGGSQVGQRRLQLLVGSRQRRFGPAAFVHLQFQRLGVLTGERQ